jgi:hypothetical protein
LYFQAQENLGTVMIFTLVSSAQEWLNTKWDEIRKRREEYAVLKQREAEEAERVGYLMSFKLHFVSYTSTAFLNQASTAHCRSMSSVEHESPSPLLEVVPNVRFIVIAARKMIGFFNKFN